MQRRGLILLAAAAAVFGALAIAAAATGDRYASSAPADRPVFPSLAGELVDVALVALERKGFAVTFRRRGDAWLVAQKGGYPAVTGKIRQVVLTLADMRLVEPKTRHPDLYSRLDVEGPASGNATLVTVADKSGKTLARLIVGKRRFDRLGEGHAGVYVRQPGDAQSWLASGDLDLSGDLASWLDRQIVDIPESRIAKVSLTQPDGTLLVLSRAKPDGQFAVENAPAKTKFKSDAATDEPAMALASLSLDDVMPAAKMPVPESGIVAASYTTFEGLTIDLRLVEKGKTEWIAVAATGAGKAAGEAKEIEARVSGWSYAIPSYKAAMIRTKLADLIEPQKGS
jgi:Domain of unknown function (DUF4340)